MIKTPAQKLKEIGRINQFLISSKNLAEAYELQGKRDIAKEILRASSKASVLRLNVLPRFFCGCGLELKADSELHQSVCQACIIQITCFRCGQRGHSIAEQRRIVLLASCYVCANVN